MPRRPQADDLIDQFVHGSQEATAHPVTDESPKRWRFEVYINGVLKESTDFARWSTMIQAARMAVAGQSQVKLVIEKLTSSGEAARETANDDDVVDAEIVD